jgi:DNA-binding beta-propeller fold protein YncE
MKTPFFLISTILFLMSLIFGGCSRDTIVNTPVVSTQGVFVLYEGTTTAGSGDYSFIDLSNDNVYNNVFQNSNSGAYLPSFPDGISIFVNRYLYIVCQGNYGGPGKMFKVDASTNKLLDTSANFGTNPYNLVYAYTNGTFYVTNIGGSTVTQIDTNTLQVHNNSLSVGPNPADPIFAIIYVYVPKASFTTENSLAIINTYTNQVSKAYFTAPPVSAANNSGGIYVSSYTNKKLYLMDSVFVTQVDDSIIIPTSYVAIGDVIAGDSRTLLIVALNVENYSDVGKEVWKYDIVNKTSTLIIPYLQGKNIYGISYEPNSRLIYISDAFGGNSNGQVRVYDTNGQLMRTYYIGGKFPRRFAYKYEQ